LIVLETAFIRRTDESASDVCAQVMFVLSGDCPNQNACQILAPEDDESKDCNCFRPPSSSGLREKLPQWIRRMSDPMGTV
jgi:hypothetical protein